MALGSRRLVVGGVSAVGDGEEALCSVDSFQLVHAAVLEPEAGAGDDVLDRLRHEHFATGRLRHHPCGQVDCDPAEGAVPLENLADVNAGTDVDAELARGLTL